MELYLKTDGFFFLILKNVTVTATIATAHNIMVKTIARNMYRPSLGTPVDLVLCPLFAIWERKIHA